jgi:hypothetical protein
MMSSDSRLRSAVAIFFALPNTRSHSADLKFRVLPSVTWELASSTAVSRAVDKGGEHTKKALDSPPSWLSPVRASSKSWDGKKGWCGEEGEEEAKGEVRH